jgi:hypothetical protein
MGRLLTRLSVNSETENKVGRPKKVPKKRGFPPKPVDMVPVKDIERLKREIRQEARYELEEERYKKKQEQRELVREAARIAYIDRIPVLSAIVDAEESSNRDKISAMSELAKVSGLYQMDVTSNGKTLETNAIVVKFVHKPILDDDDPQDIIDGEFLDASD